MPEGHEGAPDTKLETQTSGDPQAPGMAQSASESRLFRLENKILMISKDISTIKGEMGDLKGSLNTLRWQIGAVLMVVTGGRGTLLGFLIREKMASLPEKGATVSSEQLSQFVKIDEGAKIEVSKGVQGAGTGGAGRV